MINFLSNTKKLRFMQIKEIYKRACYSVENLIAKKKNKFFENKLYIGKTKDFQT